MLLRVRYTADRPSPLLTLPLPPAEKAVTNSSIRLPPVRLVLERHTYFPGDTINGYILVNVQEKFLALNVRIHSLLSVPLLPQFELFTKLCFFISEDSKTFINEGD
jgi:hypothetical protein